MGVVIFDYAVVAAAVAAVVVVVVTDVNVGSAVNAVVVDADHGPDAVIVADRSRPNVASLGHYCSPHVRQRNYLRSSWLRCSPLQQHCGRTEQYSVYWPSRKHEC